MTKGDRKLSQGHKRRLPLQVKFFWNPIVAAGGGVGVGWWWWRWFLSRLNRAMAASLLHLVPVCRSAWLKWIVDVLIG